jgi:hypothetical protein
MPTPQRSDASALLLAPRQGRPGCSSHTQPVSKPISASSARSTSARSATRSRGRSGGHHQGTRRMARYRHRHNACRRWPITPARHVAEVRSKLPFRAEKRTGKEPQLGTHERPRRNGAVEGASSPARGPQRPVPPGNSLRAEITPVAPASTTQDRPLAPSQGDRPRPASSSFSRSPMRFRLSILRPARRTPS